jgi:hypothetical protein
MFTDQASVWSSKATTWEIDGFFPGRISNINKQTGGQSIEERIKWLSNNESHHKTSKGTYRAFAQAYERDGLGVEATRVLISMAETHNHPALKFALRPTSQGYKPQRALRTSSQHSRSHSCSPG